MSYDRFCGGQLHIESNQDESVPLYSMIASQITWLQVCIFGSETIEIRTILIRTINIRVFVIRTTKIRVFVIRTIDIGRIVIQKLKSGQL